MAQGSEFTEEEMEELKKEFLKEYSNSKTISTAVSGLAVSRRTVHTWLQEDFDFKEKFDEARLAVGESLESNAFRLIDQMMVENDYKRPLLLITMLNAHLPERYKQSDTTGEDSRQLISEFRKMAKTKKLKVVKEAEDIINDSDPK